MKLLGNHLFRDLGDITEIPLLDFLGFIKGLEGLNGRDSDSSCKGVFIPKEVATMIILKVLWAVYTRRLVGRFLSPCGKAICFGKCHSTVQYKTVCTEN